MAFLEALVQRGGIAPRPRTKSFREQRPCSTRQAELHRQVCSIAGFSKLSNNCELLFVIISQLSSALVPMNICWGNLVLHDLAKCK